MGSLLYITYSRQLLRWLLYAAYPGTIGWSGIMDKYLSKERLKLSTEQFFKFLTCTGILQFIIVFKFVNVIIVTVLSVREWSQYMRTGCRTFRPRQDVSLHTE